MELVLASASPARLRLLRRVGIEPIVQKSGFDESQVKTRDPKTLVTELATAKAQTVAPKFPDHLILGCDSVMVVAGEIYGKPENEANAIALWQQMRGKQGTLYTGHTLIDSIQNQQRVRCGITTVYLSSIDDRAIADYVATGEPLNCAGGFALEGRGGLFVEKIEGCHSNVVGLSLPLFRQMLEELGYKVSDFWKH
ncbi:Maf family protein [Dactylococcopsis salina]|uniref:Nucleoside triphosphate pyrophosphatase n=1 Tax=Dactylococcopsis salina (strain PCC 8305) TaxID=13035 RepID=K9YYI4_DACS8|nr:nucleoside triphosphate pyrophosphatase [Dactylococcopsis salina]AFZ51984.1 MAF protein [Dactylococcopsis salina PCC 8305]